ncbi:MAG: hypothetical protein J1E03_09920 [Acetatifactor sp.]|nr:hypothetical protein [Acetatifactor sp.]
MPQKLSAMNYIKNNRRRTAVLIVSLSLCFVLTYLTQFLLSTTEETFRSICVENTKKIQYINLAGSSLGLDVSLDLEELMPLYVQANQELGERLETHPEIKKVIYSQLLYEYIMPAIGQMTVELPLVEPEEVPVLLEHMRAVLAEGRMPEMPGEMVLDQASMKNNGYALDGYFNENSMGTSYKIVGVLDYDGYFGCGIAYEMGSAASGYSMLIVLSEGIEDMSSLLLEEGIEVRDTYDNIFDYKQGMELLQTGVIDVIGNSTRFIYVGVILLLSIALLIVYTMYLRDRHEEWCLYSSIGYARRTVYFSILRELLFTFVAALAIGGVIILGGEVLLDAVMIQSSGLKCRYFLPSALGEILCTYVMIFGILQIPVRYALYKIRTVDALEEDMY